jgi:propanediol dehydratase small subunit
VSQEDLISAIVREVLNELSGQGAPKAGGNGSYAVELDIKRDFPLAEKRPELVKTAGTGKPLSAITLEAVVKGDITAEEIRITPETLQLQSQVAEKAGRPQLARNMLRAAELTKVSDERILQIYNALRPYRSTKAELLAIADELEQKYGAKINADFVREAAHVYESRGRLKTG